MTEALPAWPVMSAFLLASLVLAATPGPGVLFILMRSGTYGRVAGLVTVAGVALGNLGNALGTGVGLAALLAGSPLAFTVVRYAGALYLVYLGVRTWRAGPPRPASTTFTSHANLFWQGALVALLNPKTALFFAAFLPQFMSRDANPWLQGTLLGAAFVMVAAVSDGVYALVAGSLHRRITRDPASVLVAGRIAGAVFVALGVAAMFS